MPNEIAVASNKVMIKKKFDSEAQERIYNLHSVSASCPILNLHRNKYSTLYLKANQISEHILADKTRIQHYLRQSNLNLHTFQKFEECFLKCDK